MPANAPHAPGERTRSLTMYERYLRTNELLRLQKPEEERIHPDELLFQVVHQSIELWWKATVQQLEAAASALRAGHVFGAGSLIRRAVSMQPLVMQALHQLDALAPRDFLTIRGGLGDGSGADSPGFRAILRTAPALWEAFTQALQREELTLFDVYSHPETHTLWHACAEALTDFDQAFQQFRTAHFLLAERHLGPSAIGTGGTPMPSLERTLHDQLFPELWEVRDELLTAMGGASTSAH